MRDCANWVFMLVFLLLSAITAITAIRWKTGTGSHVVAALSCVCLLMAIINGFQGVRSCPVTTAESGGNVAAEDASVLSIRGL